jgi:HJR/Mrr/RecB family endonuclease
VVDNERLLKALKQKPKDIFKLTPRQFEEVVADLLQDMDYDVKLTKQTRDGGTDILASKKTELGEVLCLVDTKKYKESRKIGVGMVRTLLGTLTDYNATNAMLATTSTYSPEARALQEKHKFRLSLKDYTDVVGWIQKFREKG